jgi:hypothetical protein
MVTSEKRGGKRAEYAKIIIAAGLAAPLSYIGVEITPVEWVQPIIDFLSILMIFW